MRWIPDDALGRLRDAADRPEIPGGRYEILDRLARGGMGCVWRARDTELARDVAIKVLDGPAIDDRARTRMVREARILARLEHPGIVPVHDVGDLPDGRTWYAMKRVDGRRLDEVARGSTPLAERLRLFGRICEAVAFAHARGVVHRDLKPDNVMVGSFGEVLVMDWGVARVLDEAEIPEPPEPGGPAPRGPAPAAPGTRPGTVLGTPGWMSPEQAAGRSDAADRRSDVWALGAILGHLAETSPEPPTRRLRSIVLKATAAAPDLRYESAEALAEDVRRHVAGEAVLAHRESWPERAARLARPHSTAILLVAGYLLVRFLMLRFAGT
jgi:serine/threonine protein kinase